MSTETLSREVSKPAGWSVFMGFLTAAIGVAMIVYPFATATVSTLFLGWALIVAALAQIVFAFSSDTAGNFFLKLLPASCTDRRRSGLLALPGGGMMTLTAGIGAMLIVEAVFEVALAFAAAVGDGPRLAHLQRDGKPLARHPDSRRVAEQLGLGDRDPCRCRRLINGISRIVVSIWVRSEARQFQRSSAHA